MKASKAMLVGLVSLLVILVLAGNSISAYSRAEAIQKSYGYLQVNQAQDGGFSADGLSSRDTASACRALAIHDPDSETTTKSLIWLKSHDINGTEPLARTMEALQAAAQNDPAITEILQSYLQEATTFGSFIEFQPNILDTALAVRALSKEGNVSSALLADAVNYLKTSQNADGGWGYVPGDLSDIYISSITAETLAELKNDWEVTITLDLALGYLTSQFQDNGSIGSSSLLTAETLNAFIAGERQLPALTVSPVDYLLAAQLPNGSWESDIFITSEVMLSLIQVSPDLAIYPESVILSNLTPSLGETLTVTAVVKNIGSADAGSFTVGYFNSDPEAGGSLLGEVAVNGIAGYSETTVIFSYQISGAAGNGSLYIVADPEGVIDPQKKINNTVSTQYTVKSSSDLAISSYCLTFTPGNPQPGQAVQVDYAIYNLGEGTVDNALVNFYDGDPNNGGTLLSQWTVLNIIGGGMETGSFSMTFQEGSHNIYAAVDPTNAIFESNESNNVAIKTLTVSSNPSNIDLSISSSGISLSPMNPQAGTSVTISATIANLGTEAANASVDFYDGSVISGTYIGTTTISLPAGGIAVTSSIYAVLPTTTYFTVVVDPANAVAEMDETNNMGVKAISATLPDLTLSVDDISFSANPGMSGQDITIATNVHNVGASEASSVQVEFFKGNPLTGGVKIGATQTILQIQPYSSQQASVISDNTYWGQYQIYVVVDRIAQIIELDEGNNQSSKALSVLRSDVPDVFVDENYDNQIVVNPDTLELTGSISLNIGNAGYHECANDFYVSIYEDSNRNMRYDSSTEKEFGRSLVTANIPKNQYVSLLIPVSGVTTFSSSIIAAMADSSYAVVEVDESNNSQDLISTCIYQNTEVTVSGECDLWLAGQPIGTQLSVDKVGDDVDPKQRAQNSGLTLFPGQVVFVSATGATGYAAGTPLPSWYGPNGQSLYGSRGGVLGISYLNTGWNSLTGVFLGDEIPDPNAMPDELPFPGKTIFPLLQQAVKIGAGPTTMVVPEGASRLFFGSHDTEGTNYNNVGEFDVLIRVSDGPDLVPGYLRLDSTQYPDSVGIVVRLGNGSDGFLGAGIGTVSFYAGDPAGGGVLLGNASNSATIHAGGYEDLRFTWINPQPGEHTIYAIADADNVVQECNETNNSVSKALSIGSIEETLPNIAASNLSIVQDPQYEGQDYDIIARVTNTKDVDVSNVTINLYDGDPQSGGSLIGSEMLVSIPAYSEGSAQFKWDCRNLTSTHFLHVVVDPNNIIVEENELDNSTFIPVGLLTPSQPDLMIAISSISYSPSNPTQGDTLMFNVNVENLGAPVSNIPVSFYLDGDPNSGALIEQQVIQTILQTGETTMLSFAIANPSLTGTHWVCAYVDPANTIEELNEENNHGEVEFLLRSGKWNTVVTTDKGTYNPNEDADISVTVTNIDSVPKSASLSVVVLNSVNEPIAFLSPLDPHDWAAEQALNFSFIFNTAANFGGTYKVRAVILENDVPRDQAFASFGINAIPLISSSLTTDNATYTSRRPVIFTASILNSSVNYYYENLTAYVEVLDAGSVQIAHYQEDVGNLMPSANFNFLELWNTGINQPGIYTANLTVKDAFENLITYSTSTFSVIDSGSIGLTGSLAVTPTTVSYPEDVQFDFTATNTGNSEFNGIIHVKVIDPATSSTVHDFTATTNIPIGENISGTFTLGGNVLSGSNYTVGLSAEDGNGTKSLNAATFIVVDVIPPLLTALSPLSGNCINGQTTISARATDDHSGVALVEVKLDNKSEWNQMTLAAGTNMDGTYNLIYTPQAGDEGIRTLEIRVIDIAGNSWDTLPADANPIMISDITVDFTPPSVTVSSPSEGETVTPGFIPSIQGTDANAITWTNFLDGVVYTIGTAIEATGSHTLTVEAVDGCGNTSSLITRHFTVRETTPPQITYLSPVAGSCVNGPTTISARVTDNDSGVALVEFRLDNNAQWHLMSLTSGNGNDGTYTALYSPVVGDEGIRTIEIRATDLAGNNGDSVVGDPNPVASSFRVDITPPAIAVNSPTEGTSVEPGFIPDIQGTDANGVIWSILLDETSYSIGTPIEVVGSHTLVVSASDGCGNQSAQIVRHFTVQGNGGNPLLPTYMGCFAWFGCEAMTVNGNTKTYGVEAVGGVQGFGGNIGTNGSMVVNGSNTIKGDAYYGHGHTLTINGNQSQIQGTRIEMTDAIACGGELLADWVSFAQNNNLNSQVSSQYLNSSRNFTLNGNKMCTLNSGVYYFNNMTINGTSKLIINGQVTIVCTGLVTINGNSKVNQNAIPSNLALVISSSSTVTLNGNASMSMIAFAPLSEVNVNGNLTGYGNLWGKTFVGNGSVVWNRVIAGECP